MRRRDFFAAMGGGIAVLLVEDASAQQRGGRGGRGGQQMPQDIGAWLHIGEDGVVTAYTGKVEIGQNARTSLTAAVAEELRVPVASVRFVMGDTALTPFDGGTAGSQTTPMMWPQMRRAAATAREMLLDLAARKWNIEPASISMANGRAASGSHTAGYGELTQGQKLVQTIAANVPLTPATEWKVAGTSVPKVAAREIVTGAHKYPSDIKRPGLLHGKILYPPQFGAKLASLDQSAAAAIPGVKVVREVLASPRVGFGGDVVGVVAPDSETAEKAVAALRAEWTPAAAQPSSDDVYTYFKQNAEGGPAAGAGVIT
jgi:isoquinoline 1-oxidoreductase